MSDETETLVRHELCEMRDMILERARTVKEYALKIKTELDDVIRLADQVNENVEESIHFPADPWNDTSWRSITQTIIELDTKIKAYRSMKRIRKLMSGGTGNGN